MSLPATLEWRSIHVHLWERDFTCGEIAVQQKVSVDYLSQEGRVEADIDGMTWIVNEEVFAGETQISERTTWLASLDAALAEADWWAAVHRKTTTNGGGQKCAQD